jgi:hypothetical protein
MGRQYIFFFFEILQHNYSRQRDLSIPKNFVPKFLPKGKGIAQIPLDCLLLCCCQNQKEKNHKEGSVWLKV